MMSYEPLRSLPKTPEWVVDEEQPVAELIGVDLWEDTEYKHNLVGNYGMTLTFDDSVTELTETIHKEVRLLLANNVLVQLCFLQYLCCHPGDFLRLFHC